MSNFPLVSFITVNYNGLEVTLEMIRSLYQCIQDGFELIVVDNGSEQDEAEAIARREPRVRTIRSEKNLGFAGGNNLGISKANGEYYVLINNDVIIEENILPPLLDRFFSSSRIGAVGPKIRFFYPPRDIQFAGYTPMSRITLRNRLIGCDEPDRGQYDQARPTSAILGAALMVSRVAVEKAGLMPECYFLYYEEIDWCERIRKAGFELWYEPAVTVYHKGSVATGGRKGPIRTYFQARNRFLFAKRNIPGSIRWITYLYLLLIANPKESLSHLRQKNHLLISVQWRGVLDFFLNKKPLYP